MWRPEWTVSWEPLRWCPGQCLSVIHMAGQIEFNEGGNRGEWIKTGFSNNHCLNTHLHGQAKWKAMFSRYPKWTHPNTKVGQRNLIYQFMNLHNSLRAPPRLYKNKCFTSEFLCSSGLSDMHARMHVHMHTCMQTQTHACRHIDT